MSDQDAGHEAGLPEPGDTFEYVRRRIREFRLGQAFGGRLSQEALARSLGVTPNTVSRWETGTYRPDLADVERMARFFNVPVSDFFPDGAETMDDADVQELLGIARQLPQGDLMELRRYAEYRRAQLQARREAASEPGEDEAPADGVART